MPLDYQRLRDFQFPDCRREYSRRDTILYALAVGCGVDAEDLPFIYEKDLRALPTMAVVLGTPGFWLMDTPLGIDWRRVLHGEQSIALHRPLPVEGSVVGRFAVKQIVDKGPGRDALVLGQRDLSVADTNEALATLTETWVLRGEGGFGGPSGSLPPTHRVPERGCDTSCDLPTSKRANAIYRLTGDVNPLHIDPAVAKAAGFERPILHGLCTLGVAGRAITKSCCGGNPERLNSLKLRFTAPVFPGDTIRTEIWQDGADISFQARAVERDVLVLGNGYARLDG